MVGRVGPARWVGPLASAMATVAVLGGCSARARHRVLDLVFDGVPSHAVRPPASAPLAVAARAPVTPAAIVPTVFTHQPFADGKCGSCHDLSAGYGVERTAALCFRCHPDDETKGQFVHGPVAAGECLLCHEPHTAPVKAQLKSAPPALCLECHEGESDHVQQALAKSSVCTECHSPHRSGKAGLLR
jgi:predicted CXXCH cytochrome family protein